MCVSLSLSLSSQQKDSPSPVKDFSFTPLSTVQHGTLANTHQTDITWKYGQSKNGLDGLTSIQRELKLSEGRSERIFNTLTTYGVIISFSTALLGMIDKKLNCYCTLSSFPWTTFDLFSRFGKETLSTWLINQVKLWLEAPYCVFSPEWENPDLTMWVGYNNYSGAFNLTCAVVFFSWSHR